MSDVDVQVELRWSDMDAYQHVNNVAMLRLIEESRIRFFMEVHPGLGSGSITMFVAHQEIDYLRPLLYSSEPATVRIRTTRLGGSGFDLGYQVIAADGTVAAIVETSMVVVDSHGRPSPMPESFRDVLSEHLGDAMPFRRRSATVGA